MLVELSLIHDRCLKMSRGRLHCDIFSDQDKDQDWETNEREVKSGCFWMKEYLPYPLGLDYELRFQMDLFRKK